MPSDLRNRGVFLRNRGVFLRNRGKELPGCASSIHINQSFTNARFVARPEHESGEGALSWWSRAPHHRNINPAAGADWVPGNRKPFPLRCRETGAPGATLHPSPSTPRRDHDETD